MKRLLENYIETSSLITNEIIDYENVLERLKINEDAFPFYEYMLTKYKSKIRHDCPWFCHCNY